jgi:hypothetical protein
MQTYPVLHRTDGPWPQRLCYACGFKGTEYGNDRHEHDLLHSRFKKRHAMAA